VALLIWKQVILINACKPIGGFAGVDIWASGEKKIFTL